jgi:hypothetical protein
MWLNVLKTYEKLSSFMESSGWGHFKERDRLEEKA